MADISYDVLHGVKKKLHDNGDGTYSETVAVVSGGAGAGASNPTSLATGQATVTNAASLIVAARVGRKAVMITNLGSVDVFCGPAGVTISNGDLIVGARGAGKVYDGEAAIYGVVASGSQAVSYAEVY